MKKTVFVLLLAIITFSFVFAGDVIKVLRVYSGRACTTVPLAGIDSLNHSMYDSNGKLNSEYSSSIIHAIDSNYQIPINSIDSIAIGEIDAQEFDAQINEISDFINSQTELDYNKFQENLLSWLNLNENIQEATINGNKDFITIKFKNGMDFYINFQDMSFFNENDGPEKARSESEYIELSPFFDVSSLYDEEIIEKKKILYIQGHDFSKEVEKTTDYEESYRLNSELSSSPLDLEIKTIPHSLLFLDERFSDYGLILIAQTHGASDMVGAFMVDDITAIPETEYSSMYWENMCIDRRGFQIYTTYNNNNERLIIKSKNNRVVFWILPSLIARKLNGGKSIVFGNYCYSYGLAGHISNTYLGYMGMSSYLKNTEYLIYYIYNLLLGSTHDQAVKKVRDVLGDYYFITRQDFSFVQGSLSSNRYSKQRYFSIKTDEITQRADNGNPIITGVIKGYNNLKDNLKYVAFCHEGSDDFTPEDDDVIKIDIPKDKISKDGKFEFEFQSETPLKSAIVYGFCFGFEYGDNTYFGETKLYGKFDGLEYEKKEEWCFVMSSEPTVLYSYDVTTHFEATKDQKEFFIGMYSGDQLVATRQVKVEEGKNTQTTSIEFGCTKEDFTFDYANYKAKVDNLYLTAITNVTINGEKTGIAFNDPSEMVKFEVTYEQKPDVRFTSVEVRAPSFSGNDALIGYIVQATSTGTLFIESVRLVTEGEYWEKVTHDAITDLISDEGLISDYGILTVYNYKNLNNARELSSLIGYFDIKGPQLNTTSSNHIQFTSSNGKYITGARIVEGRRSAANASRSINNDANYVATDRGVRSDELILQDGISTLGVKNAMPERWKNVPIIRRK